MSYIKIDKGVPQPPEGTNNSKYPWLGMEVGDSFFVPDKQYSDIRSAASYSGSRHNRKYTVKTVTENGTKGVRVWRTL